MASFTRIQVPDTICRVLPGAVEKARQSSKILRESIQRCLMSSVIWEAAIGIAVVATATEAG